MGGRKDLTLISISGMPGQGKTTLAKRIFNDPEIQYHFHKTVWCYVSKECKIRDLMIKIVHDVSKVDVEDISKLEFHDSVERLRKSLKGKRYLIVMDDIWDAEVWRQVQVSFPDDKIGSWILFTSRNKDLVSQTGLNFISYPLRLFSEEESWELMKEKLLGCNGLGPEFLEIGKQIAICCKGLPLAVALVSSLLGKIEQILDLWNQVAENLKTYLANEGCMHIIELSYKYLPDHLKSCFLCFGAFPRGDNVRTKRLKQLWIAEGFIKENERWYIEDLAEEYLEYLVSQSIVVVTNRSPMGGIKRCNVHDLVYDLCLEKIVEENFFFVVDKDTVFENASRSKPQKYCHHRVCLGASDAFMKAMPLCTRKGIPTSQVHSLLCWEGNFSINGSDVGFNFGFLKSFNVLTVLDLETVYLDCDVLPEVILCNIHLKYLALFVPCKVCIPPSIADLWNLETLILRVSSRIVRGRFGQKWSLPDTMWRIKSLMHVYIYENYITLKLEDFGGDESYVAAQNMETLCGVILEDNRQTVEFLRKLAMLRKLKCVCKEAMNPSWFSIFGYLKNLVKLELTRERVSRNRLETCNFPQMSNLKKLTLEGLRIPWTAMSTIGQQLPNLEVLKLMFNACVGSCWDLEDGSEFSKLRYLALCALDLERINMSDDWDTPFPRLVEFRLDYCRNLKEIPSGFGDICTLNTIRLGMMPCKVSESAKQILQQQRDNGNDGVQVIVTGILEENKKQEEYFR